MEIKAFGCTNVKLREGTPKVFVIIVIKINIMVVSLSIYLVQAVFSRSLFIKRDLAVYYVSQIGNFIMLLIK